MKNQARTYMVNFYWTNNEDVITGEIAQEGFDYYSEETEAESSSLAIHQVMDYLVEQIHDDSRKSIEYHEGTDEPVITLSFGDELV